MLAVTVLALFLSGADRATDVAFAPLEAAIAASPGDLRVASQYRQLAIQRGEYDRAIKFLKRMTSQHPTSANAFVSLALAYLDKVPAAGTLKRPFLGRDAISTLGKALALEPSWLAYYVRGLVNLYYPEYMFHRGKHAIADLEQALRLQRQAPKRSYHARTFKSLGDGYYLRLDEFDKAKAIWKQGLVEFPDDAALRARVDATPAALEQIVNRALDPGQRVDTTLTELWDSPARTQD